MLKNSMPLNDFEENIDWNYNMTDYAVYFQEFNPDTKEWNYKQKIFNSEGKAKSFAAGILKTHPENGIIIKSKEYKLLVENGSPVKKYLGKETFIVKSTPESHHQLLQEVSQIQETEENI